MQSDPHWHGNECLAYGTVCDGVHVMKVSMVLMVVLLIVAIANASLYMGYMIGELL